MPFITGLMLIDAPASALNNLGAIPGARTDNTVGVKTIRAKDGQYPYVSAQAFRYWLRATLEQSDLGWKSAPIYRERKVAYTDANPIKWWDDDLFGYMRAPSTKSDAVQAREADESRVNETPTTDTITRVSPFRVSTLVSIAPMNPTEDFGVMSRHEGDPVPHEHQFYRTTLKGLFSLDLSAVGTFTYRQKTGFRNLDDVRIDEAKSDNLAHLEDRKAYRLPLTQRVERIKALFEGLIRLEGGAKLTLHYTDVAPVVVLLAVTKGGNHVFGHVVAADGRGQPQVKIDALQEVLDVFQDDILSDMYVGWVRGYRDEERAKLEEFAKDGGKPIHISHPREAFRSLVQEFERECNGCWLD